MKDGKVSPDYLVQIPEEYQKDFKPIVEALELSYAKVLYEIYTDLTHLPTLDISTKKGAKAVGLYVNNVNHGLKHPSAMFAAIKNSGVEKYIMKCIRPTGNTLKELK